MKLLSNLLVTVVCLCILPSCTLAQDDCRISISRNSWIPFYTHGEPLELWFWTDNADFRIDVKLNARSRETYSFDIGERRKWHTFSLLQDDDSQVRLAVPESGLDLVVEDSLPNSVWVRCKKPVLWTRCNPTFFNDGSEETTDLPEEEIETSESPTEEETDGDVEEGDAEEEVIEEELPEDEEPTEEDPEVEEPTEEIPEDEALLEEEPEEDAVEEEAVEEEAEEEIEEEIPEELSEEEVAEELLEEEVPEDEVPEDEVLEDEVSEDEEPEEDIEEISDEVPEEEIEDGEEVSEEVPEEETENEIEEVEEEVLEEDPEEAEEEVPEEEEPTEEMPADEAPSEEIPEEEAVTEEELPEDEVPEDEVPEDEVLEDEVPEDEETIPEEIEEESYSTEITIVEEEMASDAPILDESSTTDYSGHWINDLDFIDPYAITTPPPTVEPPTEEPEIEEELEIEDAEPTVHWIHTLEVVDPSEFGPTESTEDTEYEDEVEPIEIPETEEGEDVSEFGIENNGIESAELEIHEPSHIEVMSNPSVPPSQRITLNKNNDYHQSGMDPTILFYVVIILSMLLAIGLLVIAGLAYFALDTKKKYSHLLEERAVQLHLNPVSAYESRNTSPPYSPQYNAMTPQTVSKTRMNPYNGQKKPHGQRHLRRHR